MDYILIITFVQAWYFASTILLNKQTKKASDWLLMGWLLIIGVHALFTFLQTQGYVHSGYLAVLNSSLPFLQGPFLFLYVCSHKKENFLLAKRHLLHVVPFLVIFGIQLYYFIRSVSLATSSGKVIYVHFLSSGGYVTSIFLGLLTLYLFFSIWYTYSGNFFARNKLTWIRTFVGFVGSIWALSVFAIVFPSLINHSLQSNISMSVFALLTGLVYLSGYFRMENSEQTDVPIVFSPKYQKSLLPEEESKHIWELVEVQVRENKVYLDQDLSLKDLAEQLDLPMNKLSQAINRHANMKFTDYLNKYRVENVITLMEDPTYQHLSLLGLALDSGFSSKATFNRAFKRFTGKTPSQHKK